MVMQYLAFVVVVIQIVEAVSGDQTTRHAHYHIEHSSIQLLTASEGSPRLHTFVAAIFEVHGKMAFENKSTARDAAEIPAQWRTPRLICGHYLFGDNSFDTEIIEPKSVSNTTSSILHNYSKGCSPSSLDQLPRGEALLIPLVPASYASSPRPHVVSSLFRASVKSGTVFAVGMLLNYTIDVPSQGGLKPRLSSQVSQPLSWEDCTLRVFNSLTRDELYFDVVPYKDSEESIPQDLYTETAMNADSDEIDRAVIQLAKHAVKRPASFLEEDSSGLPEPPDPMAQVKGVVSAVGGIVNPAVEGVLKPVVKDMGEVVADTVGGVVEATLTPEASGDMKDAMNRDLVPGLVDGIVSNLSPTLAQSFPDSITEALSESMREFMTGSLSKSLRHRLVGSLTESLIQQISLKSTQLVPYKISEGIHKALNMMLTRSLSHSITPALIHALSHSPLQDFYCYYCFHHKAYCQFCTYTPSQLYYAMYYSGFYSEYYSNYYSNIVPDSKMSDTRISDGSVW